MSKGNIFMGQSSGKIGSVVTFVKNGQQMTRVWTKSGARSGEAASLPARAQRVAFGAASNEWEMYSYMCTRMYRSGKRSHESDYNYFTRINWRNFPYLTKLENRSKVHMPIPGIFSKGSLGMLQQYQRCEEIPDPLKYYTRLYVPALGNPMLDKDHNSKDLGQYVQSMLPSASKMAICFRRLGSNGTVAVIQNTPDRFVSIVIDCNTGYVNDTGAMMTIGEIEGLIYDGLGVPAEAQGSGRSLFLGTDDAFMTMELLRPNPATFVPTQFLDDTAMWLFVTNETTNDCYTTQVIAPFASEDYNPYGWWYNYQTKWAMTEACESYGYTTDVMQSIMRNTEEALLTSRQQYINLLIKMEGLTQEEAVTKADVQEMRARNRALAYVQAKRQDAENNSDA